MNFKLDDRVRVIELDGLADQKVGLRIGDTGTVTCIGPGRWVEIKVDRPLNRTNPKEAGDPWPCTANQLKLVELVEHEVWRHDERLVRPDTVIKYRGEFFPHLFGRTGLTTGTVTKQGRVGVTFPGFNDTIFFCTPESLQVLEAGRPDWEPPCRILEGSATPDEEASWRKSNIMDGPRAEIKITPPPDRFRPGQVWEADLIGGNPGERTRITIHDTTLLGRFGWTAKGLKFDFESFTRNKHWTCIHTGEEA